MHGSLFPSSTTSQNEIYQCFISVPTHQQDYLTVVVSRTALIITEVICSLLIYIPLRPIYSSFINSFQATLTSPYSEVPCDTTLALLFCSLVKNRYLTRISESVDRLFLLLLAYHHFYLLF